jgi:ribosome-associated toxin RatA of RatAB toxin-antitoxin module
MREVKRSALINKPPAEVFALINDIESYPQFLPWCTQTRVQSRTESQIVATIGVRKGALQGEWRLTPIENGCRVDLSMRFAFNNRLSAILFEGLFAETIGSLVDAFVTRARAQP